MAENIANYEGKFVQDKPTNGSAYYVSGGKIWAIHSWSEVPGGAQSFSLTSTDVASWPKGGDYADYLSQQSAAAAMQAKQAKTKKIIIAAAIVVVVAGAIYYYMKHRKK